MRAAGPNLQREVTTILSLLTSPERPFVAIVGGAVIPPLTGIAGDHYGLKIALVIPALCYVGILGYGVYARRPRFHASGQ